MKYKIMEHKEKLKCKTDHIKHEEAEKMEKKQEGKHRERRRWKQQTEELAQRGTEQPKPPGSKQ